MSVFAIAMVKDESDVIGSTVSRMRDQVDHVLIADNGSTDDTRKILEAHDVEVIDDPEVGYRQSEKMSALADQARRRGAEWVVPFDADEVHTAPGHLGRRLQELAPEVLVSEATLIDHVATGSDDKRDPDPISRMGWRRQEAAPLRKVACRAVEGLVIHQGNHGANFPDVAFPTTVTNLVQVRHFPYRSAQQMIRKARNGARAYAATDLPEEVGAHWRGYGRLSDDQICEVFDEYFYSADPEADGLIYDPA